MHEDPSSRNLSHVHISITLIPDFFPPLRDILPFTLRLPEAIAAAKTQKELEEVAQLGAGSKHTS